MDIMNTALAVLPVLPDVATNVVGGAAILASVFAKPNSQWSRKLHKIINVIGFNFGAAKNKEK